MKPFWEWSNEEQDRAIYEALRVSPLPRRAIKAMLWPQYPGREGENAKMESALSRVYQRLRYRCAVRPSAGRWVAGDATSEPTRR